MQTHDFLTSELVGGEWSASRSDQFTADTQRIGGYVAQLIGSRYTD
jgi:hypothetical protein